MGCAWRSALLLTLLLWLTGTGLSVAQLRVGFHSGAGVSQMRTDPDRVWGEKGWSLPIVAFELGGTLDYTLRTGRFGLGLSTGLELLRRGAHERRAFEQEGRYSIRSTTKEQLTLYYLEVPLLLRVSLDLRRTTLFLMGGLQGGMGLHGRIAHRVEVQNPEQPRGPDDRRRDALWGRSPGQVDRWHLAAVGRLGFEFLEDFALFGYYELGLSRTARLENAPPWMQRQSYGLGFSFFFLRYPARGEKATTQASGTRG